MNRFKFAAFLLFLFCAPSQAQPTLERIKVSDDIELVRLSDNAWAHVSVTEIPPFGQVASNGLILTNGGEAFLFDTPVNNKQTQKLVDAIRNTLHSTVTTFIPNHWHTDAMGGLDYLHRQGVKSYAYRGTIDIAKAKQKTVPQQGFDDSLRLNLKGIEVQAHYLGEGHSTDNIVVWIPSQKILFAGCMVKEAEATDLGSLSDANLREWPQTISKVMSHFPDASIVIPGHGALGGRELLTHTQELLSIASGRAS